MNCSLFIPSSSDPYCELKRSLQRFKGKEFAFNRLTIRNYSLPPPSPPLAVPGASRDSRAAGVERDVVGVGGEAGEDSIGISVGERVDLNRIVGDGGD